MKKTKILILALTLIFVITGGVLYAAYGNSQIADQARADNVGKIAGLQEKMDALFLTKVADQAMLDNMRQQVRDYFEAEWPRWLEITKMLGKTEGKTDEEMYDYQWENFWNPKFENYYLVTQLSTSKYLLQYAEDKVFSYLFSDMRYWAGERYHYMDGTVSRWTDGYRLPSILITEETRAFLRDIDTLEEMLLERGETEVVDAKLFSLTPTLPVLYIRCSGNEYFIKLSDTPNPQFEPQTLHTTVDAINTVFSKGDIETINKAKATKPAYDIEGEALMADGIIQGNENGLDPLKPLSRIEAATIIVRALGYENEPTSGNSQFTDIPNDNWGAKYANIAKDKGISQGVGDGKFAPNELVTDNQFATFVLRAAETGEFDWRQAIDMLIERGIITTEQAETMDFFTRGDMAKIIYEARAKGLM